MNCVFSSPFHVVNLNQNEHESTLGRMLDSCEGIRMSFMHPLG